MNSLANTLKAYLERRSAQYAVMINGAWGIGKTHYILNRLIPEYHQYTFHYLSLYGLKSREEIDAQLRPRLQAGSEGANRRNIICLDDLERWHGDVDNCLAYVNQLVEHEGCKCILIGNLSELSKQNQTAFTRAQEKTVRQLIQFSPPISEAVEISLQLVDYRSDASRRFVRSLMRNNASTLQAFLNDVSVGNIRIISEALQFFEIVYRHHAGVLKVSRGLAFSYFMSLLSMVILLKRDFLGTQQRRKLLEGHHQNSRGFKFLSEIGYFDEELSDGLTETSKLLLDTTFHRLDKICLSGACSIIKNGFYVKADFKGDFDRWIDETNYEAYLDRDKFYELENDAAAEVFERALATVIERLEVTNPVTILLLAERIIEDIANGAVDYDPVLLKKQIVETVDKLYDAGVMETVNLKLVTLAEERFRNFRSIYNYIIMRNRDQLDMERQIDMADFWQEIFKKPDLSEAIITKYSISQVFSGADGGDRILQSMESLNNVQLNRLVNWIVASLEMSGYTTDDKSFQNLMNVSNRLHQKYANLIGIRANHFRRMIHALNTVSQIDKAG